jgi:hypothetical protein
VVNVCGAGKRRINQTDSGEFYKTIDCTLYEDRKVLEDAGVKVCPTCGQAVQFASVSKSDPVREPYEEADTVEHEDNLTFNPVEIDTIDGEQLPEQPIVPSLPKRRAKDLVKARYRKSRFISKDAGGDK